MYLPSSDGMYLEIGFDFNKKDLLTYFWDLPRKTDLYSPQNFKTNWLIFNINLGHFEINVLHLTIFIYSKQNRYYTIGELNAIIYKSIFGSYR